MLRTKCILDEISAGDGLRISVMSRHTDNNGSISDERLTGRYDQHWTTLAPPLILIGSYYRRGLSWEEFQNKYVLHLENEPAATDALRLIGLAREHTVTLLCIDPTAEQCHRRLLAEFCLRLCPTLAIDIY